MAYGPERFWFQIGKLYRFCFRVRRILSLIIIFICWQSLSAQTFDSVDVQEMNDFIEKLQSYREGYTNYRVRFREVSKSTVLIGDLYYSKPDKMRITYRRGKDVITEVFLGEKKLLVYFVNSAIVYEQENFNTYDSSLSLSLRPGSWDYLVASYNFNFKSKDPMPVFSKDEHKTFSLTTVPKQLAYRLTLTPKDMTEGLNDLEIWVAAENDENGNYYPAQVLRSQMHNSSEILSDIYFSAAEYDQTFPADIYNFVIPPNVRIVKNHLPSLEDVNLDSNNE